MGEESQECADRVAIRGGIMSNDWAKRKWVEATNDNQTIIAEDHGDGTYTAWDYTLRGMMGTCGEPKEGTTITPIGIDDPRVKALKVSFERAEKSQRALAGAMQKTRNSV